MLSPSHVQAALEAKREAFAQLEKRQGVERELYETALAWYAAQPEDRLTRLLSGLARPGARPTAERVAGRDVALPFDPRWDNHPQARAWALEVLAGVPTVAVDGSQITRDPAYSIPVGAVQVGWFVNWHRADRPYVKDLSFEVLAPEDLADPEAAGEGFPDLQVNLRRFELECATVAHWMERLRPDAPRAVCFFDGSLILSFATRLNPTLRGRYVSAVTRLLDLSAATRVPLVGFVDTSYATDLAGMLRHLRPELAETRLPDAAILRSHLAWGQRSEALRCARDDAAARSSDTSEIAPGGAYYERVLFTYLKTTQANAPARLDLPDWLLEEEGLLEWVLDVVRAECIVGTGYPYAAETADALAVVTVQDRERFYGAFQTFLDDLGIGLRYSHKAYSKRGRR